MKCRFNVDGLKLIDKIERNRERRPASQALFNELLKYLHSPVECVASSVNHQSLGSFFAGRMIDTFSSRCFCYKF